MSVVSEIPDWDPDEEIVQPVVGRGVSGVPGGRSGSAQLIDAISPGDMLFVRGQGGLVEIGTAGGFFGHVMLCMRKPQRITKEDEEAHLYANIWPAGAKEIWSVRTAEATRQRTGLHEADMLLFVATRSRSLKLIGEVAEDEILVSGEPVELWQSPPELRDQLQANPHVFNEVITKMRAREANWSWFTAARAVTRSAGHAYDERDRVKYMKEIQECWKSDPICTSIIICFWQRALCKLAEQGLYGGDAVDDAARLIAQWMPLKADRSLPGDLLEVLKQRGWTRRTAMERDAMSRPAMIAASPSPSRSPDPRTSNSASRSVSPKRRTDSRKVTIVAETPQRNDLVVAPRYCNAHSASEQRVKGLASLKKCKSCSIEQQTTYVDFAFCAACSRDKEACMICGGNAPQESHYVPPSALPLNMMQREDTHGGSIKTMTNMATPSSPLKGPRERTPQPSPGGGVSATPFGDLQVAPRFCSKHGTSEGRAKVDVERNADCQCCRLTVQTTYANFTLCAACSDKEESCMICGSSAPQAGTYVPPAVRQPLPVRRAALRGLSVAESFVPQQMQQQQQGPPQAPVPAPMQEKLLRTNTLEQHYAGAAQMNPPRFCSRHDCSEKRPKVEECRDAECQSCRLTVETTYAQFSLCGVCSNHQESCMICGASAPQAGNYVPPSQKRGRQLTGSPEQQPPAALAQASPLAAPPPVQVVPGPPQQAMPPMPQPHQQPPPVHQEGPAPNGFSGKPRFCSRHNTSDKRIKAPEPSLQECQKCKMQLHTNHKEFTLCPGCSEQEDRCMLCGTGCGSGPAEQTRASRAMSFDQMSAPVYQQSPQPALTSTPSQHFAPSPQPHAAAPPAPPPPQAQPQFSPPPHQQRQDSNPEAPGGQAPPAGFAGKPCFCPRHDSSEKRPKAEEASFQGCQKCKLQLHTNHRELTLCPQCSEQEARCMICGLHSGIDPRMAATPVRSMVLNNSRPSPQPSAQQSPNAPQAEQQQSQGPKYCGRHATSDRRPKVDSRIQKCLSCHTKIHTNLAEFTLCAKCCQKEQRCMVCGTMCMDGMPPLPGAGGANAPTPLEVGGKSNSLHMGGPPNMAAGLMGSPGGNNPAAGSPHFHGLQGGQHWGGSFPQAVNPFMPPPRQG